MILSITQRLSYKGMGVVMSLQCEGQKYTADEVSRHKF